MLAADSTSYSRRRHGVVLEKEKRSQSMAAFSEIVRARICSEDDELNRGGGIPLQKRQQPGLLEGRLYCINEDVKAKRSV
jgi:hypothetical protein